MYNENCERESVTVAADIGATVTTALADFPSLVTVIVAVSALPPRTAPAVTSPVEETLAMASFDDDHASGRPVSVDPFELKTDAVSWTVCPYCSVPDELLSDTLLTVTGAVVFSPEHALSTPKRTAASTRRRRTALLRKC
jgi:hypothetical protein